MIAKTGCDIVHITRFQKSVKKGGNNFLGKVFSSHELSANPSIETLAGFFAAKEAVVKALGLIGEWHNIEISKEDSGRPYVKVNYSNNEIISHDISISHDGDYAMASAIFLISDHDSN